MKCWMVQGNYENIYGREIPVRESLVTIRQHKKAGEDNSRPAKYENKQVNPAFYLKKKIL